MTQSAALVTGAISALAIEIRIGLRWRKHVCKRLGEGPTSQQLEVLAEKLLERDLGL